MSSWCLLVKALPSISERMVRQNFILYLCEKKCSKIMATQYEPLLNEFISHFSFPIKLKKTLLSDLVFPSLFLSPILFLFFLSGSQVRPSLLPFFYCSFQFPIHPLSFIAYFSPICSSVFFFWSQTFPLQVRDYFTFRESN